MPWQMASALILWHVFYPQVNFHHHNKFSSTILLHHFKTCTLRCTLSSNSPYNNIPPRKAVPSLSRAKMSGKEAVRSPNGPCVLAHRVIPIREKLRSHHPPPIIAVAFSPDSKMIASTSPDRTILLWDAATGKGPRKLKGPADWRPGLAFSPDGMMIVSAWFHTVSLWNVAKGE